MRKHSATRSLRQFEERCGTGIITQTLIEFVDMNEIVSNLPATNDNDASETEWSSTHVRETLIAC